MDSPQEQAGLAWQTGVWNRISDVYLREIDRRFEPVVGDRGHRRPAPDPLRR